MWDLSIKIYHIEIKAEVLNYSVSSDKPIHYMLTHFMKDKFSKMKKKCMLRVELFCIFTDFFNVWLLKGI